MNDLPLIRLENISKFFGKVQANNEVNLTIEKGKVLALLGENGAGKSTLMSILAGQLQPDQGAIFHNGKRVHFTTTEKAISAGIGMVYQHFKLIDALTVAENVYLGEKKKLFLNWKQIEHDVGQLAEEYGITINPKACIRDLSMGEKQQVEILKLLWRQSSILIFDEPTAVLTPKEAETLFSTMRQMAAGGKGIVFISHKLEEVMAIADTISILRRGKIIDTLPVQQVSSTADLAKRMVGREVLLQVDKQRLEPKQTVVKIEHLSDGILDDINLELRQGEILGIVGVAGNGQKQLVETLCGLKKPSQGNIRILGMEWRKFFATTDWKNSLSYIPEDRQGLATCQGLDLLDNFLLTTRQGFTAGPFIKKHIAKEKFTRLINEFDIRPPDPDALAWQLSGGNLQKMVLSREFYRQPRLIVAEQPTQGLDIKAAEDVWQLLIKACEAAGILLVTGDLSEALALSDRLAVMFEGRIVDIIDSYNTEKINAIPEMMAGIFPSRNIV